MSEIAFPGNDPYPEVPDEYVRRSALPRPRRAPICGPPKTDAQISNEKLLADAILLERAHAALRRRISQPGDYDLSMLGGLMRYAGDWREQAEAPG